jgi:hypothetical protein
MFVLVENAQNLVEVLVPSERLASEIYQALGVQSTFSVLITTFAGWSPVRIERPKVIRLCFQAFADDQTRS